MKGSEIFPSKWLKATDLGDSEPTVIIERVVEEDVSQTERKPVIYFRGKKKGMVCNKTNWSRIGYIYKSDESDDWIGKPITLCVELVEMKGQMKPAIRVKASRPAASPSAAKPPLKHVVEQRKGYSLSSMTPGDSIDEMVGSDEQSGEEIPF